LERKSLATWLAASEAVVHINRDKVASKLVFPVSSLIILLSQSPCPRNLKEPLYEAADK
jgi:hypothetical protein